MPKVLKEVSGIQYSEKENAFWMLNDSGNSPLLYLVSEEGKILKELTMNAKNTDWEDITQDSQRNIYIGDFGNNSNERKDLTILKINHSDLYGNQKINVTKTQFYYPEQKKFPPKKKKRYYDAEAFFEWNGFFYIFTKSRVKGEMGRTFLYKVLNSGDTIANSVYGKVKAQLISNFTTCSERDCQITGADISKEGKKVVLLNHKSVWIFSNFKGDDFFSGNAKEYLFEHSSQKESVTFKNDTIIRIADERFKNEGGKLYGFIID
ncbi:MAG: hypothetical protein GKR88_16220 [Flavobacteriaceae bacterium]|nr:MAG: hypothetical protein GKR88_16220 [Flavobacteriaceae bacterium]